jgi:DNA-directed RNA polymerase specialized sigma24 family protein
MIPNGADLEFTREELSRAILDALATWRERDRRIFTRVRYEGESAESAARQEGIDPGEARAILAACERELLERLRVFRATGKAQGLARAAEDSLARCGCGSAG